MKNPNTPHPFYGPVEPPFSSLRDWVLAIGGSALTVIALIIMLFGIWE